VIKIPKISHNVPYFHTSLTLQRSGRPMCPPQHVIPKKRHLHNGVYIKYWGGGAGDAVTFCQRDLSAPCVSLALGAEIISWQAIVSLWNVTCAPRSTWTEYDGTSKRGSGLWNMLQWVLRTFQSGWEIQSWVFRLFDSSKVKRAMDECILMCQINPFTKRK
jgi:hypothetical protein